MDERPDIEIDFDAPEGEAEFFDKDGKSLRVEFDPIEWPEGTARMRLTPEAYLSLRERLP